jgi:integrase
MAANYVTLTSNEAVAALPLPAAGKSRAIYFDARRTGLAVYVYETGARTFYLVRRPDNARGSEQIKIGRFPMWKLAQARKECDRLAGKLADHVNPNAEKRKQRDRPTLGAVFETYLADRAAKGKKRTADFRAMFELYLGTLPDVKKKHARKRVKPDAAVDWSQRKAHEITHAEVVALHASIGTDSGRTTANRVVELLSAMFNRAKLPNPADGIEPFPETKRIRWLTGEEIKRFFAALDAEHVDSRDLFMLSLWTGARRANVCGMRWADMDLASALWTVPGEKSKSGEPLVIPITTAALEVLQLRRAALVDAATGGLLSEWVFPGGSKAGHVTQFAKDRWEVIRKRAGLEDVRIHDLRRSLGSWMVNTGASIAIIGAALGHKDAKPTEVYARLSVAPVRDAMETAQAAILAAAKPATPPPTEPASNVIPLPARRRRSRP